MPSHPPYVDNYLNKWKRQWMSVDRLEPKFRVMKLRDTQLTAEKREKKVD